MIYTSFSIHNDLIKYDDMSYLREKHEMCDVVRYVAFVNSQKLPSKGLTSTDHSDLWESIGKHSDLLKRQVELLDPNVFIFCNTINLYENVLNLDFKKLKTLGTCQYMVDNGKLYISAYHPSQRSIKRVNYVNDILEAVKVFRAK